MHISPAERSGAPIAADMETRQLLILIANELEQAREQLEALADTLCCDEGVVSRHITALQMLDSVGQRQAAIAEILRAENILVAAHAHSLEAIRRLMAGFGDVT